MASVAELLKGIPYLRTADAATRESMAKAATRRSYDTGEVIFLEGEPCAGLYCLEQGRVKIFKLSSDGREQILHIAGPGESFNEVAVFDSGPNPASTMALEPVVAWVIERSAMMTILRERPELCLAVIEFLAARLRQLVGLVEDLSLRPVAARLAKLLLDQAAAGGSSRLTHEQMAARLGTVREVVSRALRVLQSEGLIRVERHRIIISDRAGLERKARL